MERDTPSAVPTIAELPWRLPQIQSLLPHREPFLFVDRVDRIEPDQLIVGSRTWAQSEARVLAPDGGPVIPGAYLIECMAQVGALLVLSKPENIGKLIYFLRIDRVRLRSPVHPGETLEVTARVERLRSRTGLLAGRATVGDRLVADGKMTFALETRTDA